MRTRVSSSSGIGVDVVGEDGTGGRIRGREIPGEVGDAGRSCRGRPGGVEGVGVPEREEERIRGESLGIISLKATVVVQDIEPPAEGTQDQVVLSLLNHHVPDLGRR